MTEPRAVDALRERGLSMEVRTESGEPATNLTNCIVIRQSPSAGARVANGTPVTLTVAPAGTSGTTPPQNAGGSMVAGTVPAPTGSGVASPAVGGNGAAGSGGAVPAAPAPAPASPPLSVPAPAPAPPAAPAVQPPAVPVSPPPPVHVPAPLPSVPLPTIPVPVPLGFAPGIGEILGLV